MCIRDSSDTSRHVTPFLGVVAQAQHHQRITQASETHADAALVLRLLLLLRQGPVGQVQDIVQSPHLQGHAVCKSFKVKFCFAAVSEWTSDKPRKDDGAEVATTVGRQRLLTAGIGGADGLNRSQVVISVDLIQKQDSRLRKVVGRAHDRVPKLRRS